LHSWEVKITTEVQFENLQRNPFRRLHVHPAVCILSMTGRNNLVYLSIVSHDVAD
jgi:hypothetical protein